MGNKKLEQQKIVFKKKDLPPATLSSEEFDDLLRNHFDMTIMRNRGIPKDFCERINGIPTVEKDGTEVCTVSVFKSKDMPDVMVPRKISRELLQTIKIEEEEEHKKPGRKTGLIHYKHCLYCGKQFETKRWNKKYCTKGCRFIYLYPKTKKQIIDAMRKDYKRIKERDPLKAQEIADEMERTEGKKFRDLALGNLAPFNNPKKYDKKRNIIRSE